MEIAKNIELVIKKLPKFHMVVVWDGGGEGGGLRGDHRPPLSGSDGPSTFRDQNVRLSMCLIVTLP